jgi:zinc D-Ala-D-Ala carboxypeptidase
MNLSENFTLDEMTLSQTAARHGIDNVPPPHIIRNLELLCVSCMQPLREEVSRPIFVSSGFRSPDLNSLIGGSKTSAHQQGNACDFRVSGLSPYDTCLLIVEMGLPFDQVIHEFGKWVHLGVGDILRGEELTAYRAKGKTKYSFGIKTMEELQ